MVCKDKDKNVIGRLCKFCGKGIDFETEETITLPGFFNNQIPVHKKCYDNDYNYDEEFEEHV
jgi:hypothetical protein